MKRITVGRSMRVYTTYEVDEIPPEWRELLEDDVTEDQELAAKIVAALEASLAHTTFAEAVVGDEADEPEYNIWIEDDDG